MAQSIIEHDYSKYLAEESLRFMAVYDANF